MNRYLTRIDIYTAATLLIAASIFEDVLHTMPQSTLNESVEQAFSCLRIVEKVSTTVHRYRKALEVLRNKITTKGTVAWFTNGTGQPDPGMPIQAENDVIGITQSSDIERSINSMALFNGMDNFWVDSTGLDLDLDTWLRTGET